jgi:hypothetical protein
VVRGPASPSQNLVLLEMKRTECNIRTRTDFHMEIDVLILIVFIESTSRSDFCPGISIQVLSYIM